MSQQEKPIQATADPAQRRQVQRVARLTTIAVLVLLALGAGRTMISRLSNARTLEAHAQQSAAEYVRVTHVRTAGAGQKLVLPGTLQGYVQAPVAARAGGYLRRWTKDIGS